MMDGENKRDKVEDKAGEEDALEIEVVDDRPEEDRVPSKKDGKDGGGADKGEAGSAKEGGDDDNEAEEYSARVKKRIDKLKYDYHEERRAKEEAEKQREVAIDYAKSVMAENNKLKSTLHKGENVVIESKKAEAEAEVAKAKKDFKDAAESGDPDAMAEAQVALTSAQAKKIQAESYRPVHVEPERQPAGNPGQEAGQEKVEPPIYKPTTADVKWRKENPWFETDRRLTAYAYAVHQDLIEQGFNPVDDPAAYYSEVDSEMRKEFPDRFAGENGEEAPRQQTGSVVAPAGRSASKPRTKVQLTSSEVAVATQLGQSPEKYAAQKLKLEEKGES